MTNRTPSLFGRAARSVTVRLAVTALLVAATLALSAQRSDQASAADGASLEAVFGNVVAVSVPDSVTVATSSEVVKLLFTEDSELSGQGIESLADVGEGDRIVATADRQEDGTLVARRVLVQPVLSKPVTKHIFGVVVEAEAGIVVVQDQDGSLVTLDVTSGIETPEPGEAVTVIASLDRSTGRLEARAFQSVADTVRRIQDAADTANEAEQARLEKAAEEARAKHLSVLQQAREALERARAALANASGAEITRAEARLLEVQARYELVRRQYEDAARAADRPAPSLRLNGTLLYNAAQWSASEGVFELVPRGAGSVDDPGLEFVFTSDTLVTFTVIDGDDLAAADGGASRQPVTGGVTAGVVYRHSAPTPLGDVKELIQSGSSAIVIYNPDQRPLTAQEIIILPPELSGNVSNAIEAERLRSFQGVITLVEQTTDTDGVDGIVVVASDARGEKVVAIVTPRTDVTLDGANADITDLAAGHNVDVVFEAVTSSTEGVSGIASQGRFHAAAIDAQSTTNQDEVGIVGVIREIVPAEHVVVVVTRSGTVRARIPLGTRIWLNGLEARFENLTVGDFVLDGTRYNRRTGALGHLVAASPREQAVRGTIVGLAVDPTRVVVSTNGSDVVTLVVNDRTDLNTEDGRDLVFRDLEVGQLVVEGAYEFVNRDGATHLVATDLVIAGSQVVIASGRVVSVDADTPAIHIDVTRSTAGSNDPLILGVSDRSVLYKNGQLVGSLEFMEPDDTVDSVAYSPSTDTIVKLSVSTPNLAQTRGTVSRISTDRRSIVVASTDGRSISLRITDTTSLSLNGRQIENLRGIDAGDTVSEASYIASANDRTVGTALSIALLKRQISTSPTRPDAPPSVETTVSGVIEGFELGAWMSISGRRFRITSQTEFFGAAPEVGLVANASLRLGSDSVFVATTVSVAGRPSDNPVTRPIDVTPVPEASVQARGAEAQFRVSGEIESIGNSTVVIDSLVITRSRNTRIVGTLEVGRPVVAMLTRSTSGALVAVELVVESSTAASSSSGAAS